MSMRDELTAWGGEFKGAEADIVEGFIVQNHALIGILNKLVNRECCIVRLNNSVRHLRRWEHREGEHHSVRAFFPDLGDQEGSHSGTSSTTKGVTNLKP